MSHLFSMSDIKGCALQIYQEISPKCLTGLSRVSLLSFQKYLHSETKTIIDCHVMIVLVQESL
jgi:hypothetical protein